MKMSAGESETKKLFRVSPDQYKPNFPFRTFPNTWRRSFHPSVVHKKRLNVNLSLSNPSFRKRFAEGKWLSCAWGGGETVKVIRKCFSTLWGWESRHGRGDGAFEYSHRSTLLPADVIIELVSVTLNLGGRTMNEQVRWFWHALRGEEGCSWWHFQKCEIIVRAEGSTFVLSSNFRRI